MIASLVNHLWQSTLFALAIALAAHAFRDDAARIRYALWMAASVKFLVPFSLLAALGARLAPMPEQTLSGIAEWQVSLDRLATPIEADSVAEPIAIALLALWLAGTILIAGHTLLRARRLGELVRSAACAPATGIGAPLPIKRSNDPVEPALVGIWRPVLLLPRDVEARLSRRQLE